VGKGVQTIVGIFVGLVLVTIGVTVLTKTCDGVNEADNVGNVFGVSLAFGITSDLCGLQPNIENRHDIKIAFLIVRFVGWLVSIISNYTSYTG
jgi:hypothetical protein